MMYLVVNCLLFGLQDERKNEGPFEMTHGGVSDGDGK